MANSTQTACTHPERSAVTARAVSAECSLTKETLSTNTSSLTKLREMMMKKSMNRISESHYAAPLSPPFFIFSSAQVLFNRNPRNAGEYSSHFSE
ncbi:uncharacterized protein MONOS_11834 [Monocercomonoides exilis]|uniref:uncharacterized protein n=1 Tax=Monocercomonoides exilis TaxID=2049356 RepID=UPI0035598647|nr:hypothetical protein MONOS_11834 [Monocercomonoides exilis]|eukprot:MONOS_11834.1-p1 / transcript=MONOS_11834.1 / gene=MONOS_11834 / organism=Monocercomonoides_exilis_PA203 / gene_product=unspecified product / transcript_product=unspecified product / location=Mono_scaffold00616:40080-40364(+) / protein_length=95 / sequence_SO=supercontig / SO=protein_coding / is_pseudo=false